MNGVAADMKSTHDSKSEAGFALTHPWATTCVIAVLGALLNQYLSVVNNGRLTFMLLWPAVIVGGFLEGFWAAMTAALIGGIALALFVGRTLQSFLYGVTAGDPLTLTGVCILFLSVASFARCGVRCHRCCKAVLSLRCEVGSGPHRYPG